MENGQSNNDSETRKTEKRRRQLPPDKLATIPCKNCRKNNTFTSRIFNLNLLPDEQFGFRESHGAELQLLRLVEEVHQAMDVSNPAVGVFLDIKNAFDSVSHQGLVSKLINQGINPTIVRLIYDFLKNRFFSVHVGESSSAPKALRAGLPQGAVLSPTLYNLYTADFPRSDAVPFYAYADDIALLTSSHDENMAHRRMQAAINKTCDYFKLWKLRLHPDKSQHIVFSLKRKPTTYELKINQQTIPTTKVVKYLGVLLDSKLTWLQHINYARKKGSRALGMMYPMIGRSSKLSLSNKLLLYRQIARPAMLYGSAVWGSAAETLIKIIQVQQNKFIRVSCNAPFYTNMKILHEETGISTIKEQIYQSAVQTFTKAENHENPLISQSISYIPEQRPRRNHPKTILLHPEIT